MNVIHQQSFERTLDVLLRQYARESMRGTRLTAWLFENTADRLAAQTQLAQFGVEAQLLSAYKPLVHHFLASVDLDGLEQVSIDYPIHPAAPENRFLLEAYPLAALVGQASIRFNGVPTTQSCCYRLTLSYRDRPSIRCDVAAPNRLHIDHVGMTQLSPTGWLQVERPDGSREDARLEAEFEALFAAAMRAVMTHPWGAVQPYFETLAICVTLPQRDQPLPFAHEALSLSEALHEDFYFSLLEVFQQRSGKASGDRTLQPGQIMPEIRWCEGAATLEIGLRALTPDEPIGPQQSLHTAGGPLSMAQVRAELDTIPGTVFTAQTRSGRSVPARYRQGTDAPVMISGGQHANETSGVVGVLRAAQALNEREHAHFTLAPMENPDGYAAHQRLCLDNPRHMHHAARYTAFGDDLEYRTGEPFEQAIRHTALALTGAKLHINLHGYPSHEWTRPLNGYVPRNFGLWSVPKGFFLILRHHSAWTSVATTFIERVTLALADVPGLLQANAEQVALYKIHAGQLDGFQVINGFPCLITIKEVDTQAVPLTFITEYPDQTLWGDAFVASHTVQMQSVLAAYDTYQALVREQSY